tara:strand:- start:1996 stop:2163 length:168 start_codon:yes stop_codon:yes gene_type:complete
MSERTGQVDVVDGFWYAILLRENGTEARRIKSKSHLDALERIEYWAATGLVEENW